MHIKGWIGIGSVAVVVIGLYAVAGYAGLMDQSGPCGLGLPPDAPGFADAKARDAAEMKKNGFLRVCEANLRRYHISFVPLAVAEAALAFKPAELTRTPFNQYESLGGRSESVSETRSRLYRGFRMSDGHTLTLSEHDLSADGTTVWRDPTDEPERINGLPARLNVIQAHSGNAISHLSWVEGRRSYELWVNANVAHQPLREQLFALAASLPTSVKACPNEPPPRSARLGPDGRPAFAPPPAVLSEEEFKSDSETKRTCK